MVLTGGVRKREGSRIQKENLFHLSSSLLSDGTPAPATRIYIHWWCSACQVVMPRGAVQGGWAGRTLDAWSTCRVKGHSGGAWPWGRGAWVESLHSQRHWLWPQILNMSL